MSTEDCKKESKPKATIYPYLYFKGNASAAIDWYVEKLGAKVEAKMLFSDGPPVAEEHKNCIMHALIKIEESMVMLSDNLTCGVGPVIVGNNVTLNINWEDVTEMTKAFEGMSEGGKVLMPLEHQFWGATYGQFVDKFDITWSFNCQDAADEQAAKKARTD
jgi:PhnB protein